MKLNLAYVMAAVSSFAMTSAMAIDIDMSASTATVSGQKIVIKQISVPDMGAYDAEFTWDGAGNFRLTNATPAANNQTTNTSTGTLRTCRVTMGFGTGQADIAVKSNQLDFTITSNSNSLFFSLTYFSIKQGTNSSGIISRETSGYSFLWKSPEDFVVGGIPAGVQKSGVVTWTNAWFNPNSPFSIILTQTGESVSC